MLELREITKKFSVVPAVNNVSFVVEPSEIVGYLGPNGAGKTTTIKMLTGLLEPSSGQIYYRGRNIRKNIYDYKKKIGYVPEQSEIYPHMSAYDYLLMVGRLRLIPERLVKSKIERFMKLFDLSVDMHSSISTFSKGMIQKVLITSAFLHDPEILLLDEPLSGLDVTTGMIVRDLIQLLAKEGKIIIYSSHVLEIVEKICERAIIIHKGSIVADDSVENLRSLMHLPSLEEIFDQLIVQEDTEAIAQEMAEIIKSKG